MIEIFTGMIGGGIGAYIAVVITLKNDVKWIKDILHTHEERLTFIERNI